ncbi:amidohydrolase family protein [Mucilaginibacter sp. RS28]|uniref:Amidohydrolase family protein n=1 Tax=Mucilaginibacter straminoryzae TaxID=2932774 RepID=A0A9X1X2A2_9SPHI|nr:amidohydrolase family protein [Mucilaginibacter straminoryzae]MCJ8208645.1 amidohydrolase family protein [Mucilaginibacter straminoryzae]
MLKIDAHQHFWLYDPKRDTWITDDMSVLQKDYLPAQLEQILKRHDIDGCVVVQSDQSIEENWFQLKNAEANPFIKGIVGWVDLCHENIEQQLAEFKPYTKLKGFRHVLQGEKDRALMLKPEFVRGLHALHVNGYTYDLLVLPDQLKYVIELVDSLPDQKFVIDHLAKPLIKKGQLTPWTDEMKTIAQSPNVYCKVSGMVTEADWANWKASDFTPYLDVVFEAFGTERLMYGSDWPVCEVAGGYDRMLDLVKTYTANLSSTQAEDFWGGTAVRFYGLNDIKE